MVATLVCVGARSSRRNYCGRRHLFLSAQFWAHFCRGHLGGWPFWIFRHRRVALFRDDAEGYFLNLTSPTPCFWVFWRSDDEWLVDGEPGAMPQIVTLSYHDAGRWLDAQEKVDQVPAPPAVVGWLQAFVDQHHQVEPKRRKRPESFRPLTDRFGQPVRISTDKLRRGGA